MTTHAYLVGWYDPRTNRFFDAGVYSEATPTSPHMPTQQTVVLLSTVSRFEPSEGGYGRAMEALERLAEKCPKLRWATQARTYRLQKAQLAALFSKQKPRSATGNHRHAAGHVRPG